MSSDTITLDFVRKNPFVWPGGYPLYAVMHNGDLLCHSCIHDADVREDGPLDEWRYKTARILWEGTEHCGNCDGALDSAYGDPEEDD